MSEPNIAAFLTEPKSESLIIGPTEMPKANKGEIVIRVHATALAPVDSGIQKLDLFPWLKYPRILGCDAAGEVVQVGPEGEWGCPFKIGDRVIGGPGGIMPKRLSNTEASFQRYTRLLVQVTSPLPPSIPYIQGCSLPLNLATASTGLFEPHLLHLDYPTIPPLPENNKYLIIWGGSTSVGSCAIQLARSSGYTIITTCSPKNFDYCKELGAKQVLDYNDPLIEEKLVELLNGKQVVGALTLGEGGAEICVKVFKKSDCIGKKFVAMGNFQIKEMPSKEDGDKFMGDLCVETETSKKIFWDFLPKALEIGQFKVKPDVEVIPGGLSGIQDGLNRIWRKEISAKKLVVEVK
ncbi:hypothetical protein TREMEDRAFT_29778 [Tremella mesenterica DSM 1558]|uniref:uncharacterized protein n=1 Tax=Tremella mesenterica (strain ATCC 24925 / CBS 8224 / DSM 1558 / NBRC 9311 / NRRL Y-6157 / RJB 2259-6 / UBC 559-6) TaxID=578456 RepID=UPI0003F49426|nr:uncharacterized protein TREMEDRAFT_29778 [Tremella mesenterica DSM 1558]EIW69793.1 hypothetical protein TREMEDRAFT_29778 [Tremella mesenterica DSM 1558]